MIFTTRVMGKMTLGLLVFCCLSVAQAPDVRAESSRLDRLVALAKVWAAVKYFHPYLAYRDDIDWDAALVKAIPKVNAAQNPADYSAAVEGMVVELGDPATRVLTADLKSANPSAANEKHAFSRMTADNILVVDMTNYADFQDFVGTDEKFAALKKQIPLARAIVLDLRPAVPPTEDEQGLATYSIATSGIAGMLTSSPLPAPGERRRMHVGYAPQDGTTSLDYSSGFYTQGRQAIKPAPGAKDIPVVFVLNPHADLPEMALSFQGAGRGAIVVEGEADDSLAVTTEVAHLTDNVRAQIRLGELVYEDGTSGFAPNLKSRLPT